MSPDDRYYVTTAIAYANNRPGLHTLYEVVGAAVLARWHRMKGDRTRFLTGIDEHSVNIAQRAAELGTTPKAFVDENVALFKTAEDALLISPDRFIRTTDPDHIRANQEMVNRFEFFATDEDCKLREISTIGLDGVRGCVALGERAKPHQVGEHDGGQLALFRRV